MLGFKSQGHAHLLSEVTLNLLVVNQLLLSCTETLLLPFNVLPALLFRSLHTMAIRRRQECRTS